MCSPPMLPFMKPTIFIKFDNTIAFLHGHLKEKIFLEQPKRNVSPSKELKVCHLFKSLYGLNEAPCV